MMRKHHKTIANDFEKIRITLSNPAFKMLEDIIRLGSFRSYSHGIEETIRILHSLIENPTMLNFEVSLQRLGIKIEETVKL